MCKLDFLKILDLSNNKLSGPIPSCCGVSLFASRNMESVFVESVYPRLEMWGELNISSLFELQFLSFLELDNNNFSIIHYHGQGGNSSNNLYYLDLSDNGNLKADHMLHWISNLSFLQYQDLTGINLQDETNWLQLVRLLPSISELYLEYCGLQNIYPSLQYANFTALNVLDLSNNDFVQAKLPNWIFNFSSGELNISSLFELQFLIFLELGTMTSSSSIIMYQDLTGINLQDETNWLQLVRLLPSISELYVEYYRLRDIYPSLQYANFTAFNVLDLSNNDFVQAKFPNWIFNFSSEKKIVANGEESIVTTLLAKSRGSVLLVLKFILFVVMMLTNCIALQGENSSNNLHHLDLSNKGNLKADHILHWISTLSSMKYLDLTGINLQEETNWLQLVTLLPSLSELYLEYYGVRDIYPSLQYANFTTLDVLDLSNNDFVPAKLPHWIFNFRSGISAIFLSKYSLQGQLPQTFPHFQTLDSLFFG
ncbi:probably inactive leucine-rich repeat receptor-like protein kinase At2g25790 [Arachis ipaensis]|uniref:LRR receptor-like serine/threonine-protein kinase n=1 Tax=Arachis hypogaea TaxID=3818 RepID=A0A444XEH1_ARAHY|nr:probably inactive leucine-rich repeat receptor-like protein kinase At2g25790 [Arachis ipaensis]RYQ88126.1 hypothetical protein Ahy_B09g095525 [Arachis hypogaea]